MERETFQLEVIISSRDNLVDQILHVNPKGIPGGNSSRATRAHADRNFHHSQAGDRRRLAALARDRNAPRKHVWRAEIVLLSANGVGTREIMRRTGKSKTCVWPPAR